MHGWRLRKKTLNLGTVEYCQLWWVCDKLKNIHKHSTSKAGKEGGEQRRVSRLGHPIFSQHKAAIFSKPTYTYRSTRAGKEFFILVVPSTQPWRWHIHQSSHLASTPWKVTCNTFPQIKKYGDKRLWHKKCSCRQASGQASILLCMPDSCPPSISHGSLH